MTIIQFVFSCPCMIPKKNRSISPPENVNPTVTFNTCIIIYASPAKTQCIPYNPGAINKNVNSNGSVIPVSIDVNAAEIISPPTTFLCSGLAQR